VILILEKSSGSMEKSEEVMGELMKYVDIALGNEEDCQKSLGVRVELDVNSGKATILKSIGN